MLNVRFLNKSIKLVEKQCMSICYQASSVKAETDFLEGFSLTANFISRYDEQSIVAEVDRKLLRRKYNKGHWDNAIVLYRELEKMEWNQHNSSILMKIENHVFKDPQSCLSATHVLDLHQDGFIKPHIDSIQFCGELVSGVSLLSDAIMKLQLDEDNYVHVLVPRLSLYIMSRKIRYQYTHEILPNPSSVVDKLVERTRRITIMKRSLPDS